MGRPRIGPLEQVGFAGPTNPVETWEGEGERAQKNGDERSNCGDGGSQHQ